MLSGLAAAMVLPFLMPAWTPVYHFPFIFLISLAASILASLLTNPDDEATVIRFYRQVRPWGFWGPVYEKVVQLDPAFKKNTHFRLDMTNVAVGIVWQLGLVALPVYIVKQDLFSIPFTLAIIVVCTIFLKKNWYDKLEED